MKNTHVKSAMVAVAALALIFVSVPKSAFATTATTTIAVSTTVTNSCTLTAGSLTFAAYTGVVDNTTGTFTVNCTNNGDYTIALNKGTGTGATITTRQMMFGTYSLGYTIYTASTDTGTIWGDGTSSTGTVTGVGTGTNQTINVYGQIPAGETATSGTYTDTITATVTY